jgi:pimeloyl-ACP methyl ester carboxylesterase
MSILIEQKQIVINSKRINYKISGNGKVLVLIHGYMASSEIWELLVVRLNEKFKIITPDLPGHGSSESFSDLFTMEFMAEIINSILDKEEIQKISIAGHSMGGYVALAFAELFPGKTENLILINSHPFSDNIQKIKNRDREIEFIKKGKKSLLVDLTIPGNFNSPSLSEFKKEIEILKDIAMKIDNETLIASVKGMKNRKDRSSIMYSKAINILWMHGENDQIINYKQMISYAEKINQIKLITLSKSGHMGFIEAEDIVCKSLIENII